MKSLLFASLLFAYSAVAAVNYQQSLYSGPWGFLTVTEYFDNPGKDLGGVIIEVHNWRVVQ